MTKRALNGYANSINNDIKKRKCRLCGEWKSLDAFPKSEYCRLGVTAQCRPCLKVKNKKNYELRKLKHRDELLFKRCIVCDLLKSSKEFHKWGGSDDGHQNTCKTCKALYERKKYLKNTYGISIDEYELLKKQQNYACAICGNKGHKYGLVVDHDHLTQHIRGLLCVCCNSGIGKLNDDINVLEKAIKYLKNQGVASVRL